ncbi:hypothetical protein [Niabella beijingensis]|uniref:hypothetical protein n=1 Tax=Niabella beijingensis TaxID=2872700 RepID=UPI001CBE6D80|nr:hypothetical protein [Niabella beijingensis]MBZ4188682.1 hypothetical protein [Niabella beijingensis]
MENKHPKDLQDPERDEAKLQPDKTTMDLPEVKDIPGQENIHPPDLREMADTTIASDDEEGVGIFEADSESLVRDAAQEQNEIGDKDEISEEEVEALDQTGSEDDKNLRHARPDNKDAEGDPLNEYTGNSGKDLDVPGEELDDKDEEKGEEDEENNEYSLSDDNKQ